MQALKARLTTAQQLLKQLSGKPKFEAVSGVQARAVTELLLECKCQEWQPSLVAEITDLLLQVEWFGDHGDNNMAMLATNAPEPSYKKNRRKQQKFEALLNYFTEAQWGTLDGISDVFCKADFVCSMALLFECINPCEPTYKMWTSQCLAMGKSRDEVAAVPLTRKYAVLGHIKKMHKQMVRRSKLHATESYVHVLPGCPKELLQNEPALYHRIFKDGAKPVLNKVDTELAFALDSSFQCRGGQAQKQSLVPMLNMPHAPSDSLNFAGLLQGLMQAMSGRQENPIQYLYSPMQQRSFAAMRSQPALTAPLASAPPAFTASQALPGPLALEAPALRHAVTFVEETDEQAESSESGGPKLCNGNVLLDAILDREKAAKEKAKQKKAEEKEDEKQAALQATGAAVGTEVIAPAKAAAATKKAPAATKVAAAATKKAPAATKVAAAATTPRKRPAPKASSEPKQKKTCVSHESSRSQYLFRSYGDEPSKVFSYKKTGLYKTAKEALAAAEEWMANH